MWLMVEELDERIVAGSPIRFLESSGKTFHIVSDSRSISAKSVCTLAWKEEVVKVIEALVDQYVGRSVAGTKGLNICKLAAITGVSPFCSHPMEISWASGNCPNNPNLQLSFAS